MIYQRKIQANIEKYLFKGDIIILYGARQVGKTVLSETILKKYENASKYVNCELEQNRKAIETTNSEKLKTFLGSYKLVVLDEAQKVTDIWMVLKILHDTLPEIQIIATGLSSFDLARGVSEPMTGRAKTFELFPLSIGEIIDGFDMFKVEASLENLLRFGSYPKIFGKSEEEMRIDLDELTSKYLFRDILEFEKIKKSRLIFNMCQLLALQVGSEVSYEELAVKLGINRLTVMKYLDILEQSFVIFRLNSFSRNLRDEISRSVKVYFWDLGVRNSLIQAYNQLNLRDDVGRLWENFCIIERIKKNKNNLRYVNGYFWRTYKQKEIDYVEEADGKLAGFEFKWGTADKQRVPKLWLETYKNASYEVVNRENYWNFIG